MKKLLLMVSILSLSIAAQATNGKYFFYCKTTDGHVVKAYEENSKIVVDLDKIKFISRNPSNEIKSDIVRASPLNNDYMEFNANEYYVSLGNFNMDEEFDGKNGNEKLVIDTLSKDRKGAISTKEYKCSSDYKNNIDDLAN